MSVSSVIRGIDSLGVKPEHSLQAKRRIRFTTRLLFSGALFAGMYTLLNIFVPIKPWITQIDLLFIFLYLGLVLINTFGPKMLAKTLGLLLLNAHIFLFLFLTGPGFANVLSITVTIAAPFFLYARSERLWITVPIFVTIVLTGLCFYATQVGLSPYVPALNQFTNQLVGAILSLASVILVIRIFYQLYSRDEEELVAERAKSEKLLLNILPEEIAERLKKGEEPIADRFESVSVLFADICEFTTLSGKLQPEEVVEFLNEIFTAFDALAGKHGLEKIKTIGDAYMAVGGLTSASQEHVSQTLMFGREMLAVLKENEKIKNKGLSLRIGIHVGPVVAGVIGKNKFIYDLWGDTVNIASRMESHGLEGRIHVTENVKVLASEQFKFSSRGVMTIKGKGEMTTYLLEV